MTVTDANGCKGAGSVSISNIGGPSASVNDAAVCPGDDATLTVTVSGGTAPFFYEWETGDDGTSITVNPQTTTDYNVTGR